MIKYRLLAIKLKPKGIKQSTFYPFRGMVFVMYAKVDSPNVYCRIVETINIINEELRALG